jgi:hypothetical protein
LRIALSLALLASVCAADEPRLVKAEREMARAHHLMDQGDFAGALEHFDAARALAPETSGPYLGIGLSASALGNCDRAVPALQEYLRRKTDSPSGAARPALEACQKLAQPPPAPAQTGGVHLESLPIGAEVRLDDAQALPSGHTPIDLTLAPGPHVLYVSQSGYRSGRVDANIIAGVTIRLSTQLEIVPPPAPPAAPRGKLELYVEPAPVSVLLNGGRMPGHGPTFGAEVPGGMYRIVIEKQGYDPEYRDVLVRPGERVVQKHTFAPKMSREKKRWVAAVAVLVPLAAVGLAVGLGVGLTQAPSGPEPPKETGFGRLTLLP